MRSMLQSTGVLVCLAILVVLTLLNTFQVDGLERQVIRNGQLIEEMSRNGVSFSSNSPGNRNNSSNSLSAWDAAEAEALADPDNMLVSLGRPMTPANTVAGGTLQRMIAQDPKGLNPYISTGVTTVEQNRFTNLRLFGRDSRDPDRYLQEGAVKVTTDDDGLSYTFHLRKGVMWQRPTVDWASGRYEWLRGEHEYVADDYAFAFEIIQNAQVTGRVEGVRAYMQDLDRLEVIDDHTFKLIYTKRGYTNFGILEEVQAMPRWLYMYDEDGNEFDEASWGLKFNEHWYNNKMIGTGPYRFVEWEPGVRLVLEKSPVWAGPRPAFDKIVFQTLKDQSSWVRKFKAGELDITRLQPEQYRTEILEGGEPYLGLPDARFKTQPTLGYFYWGWNADNPLFGDKLVRQAMTIAFNRQGAVDNIFHGLGEVLTGPFPMQSPCYDTSIEPWPFDLDMASAKLEEAGWTDTDGDGLRDKVIAGERVPFEFSMLIYGSSNEYETLANIYREDLLTIGVKMTPQALEWSTMLKKMDEKDFAGYSGAWVVSWEVDLYQLWHSSQADQPNSSNRVGFRNADADVIIEALRTEFDQDKRIELCHEFHALIHEEQPYTFFYQRKRPIVYRSYLNDPEFNMVWPYRDLRYWSFNETRP